MLILSQCEVVTSEKSDPGRCTAPLEVASKSAFPYPLEDFTLFTVQGWADCGKGIECQA